MKTTNIYLFTAMAAALLAAACSDHEDEVFTELDRGVVKTEFTISFPQKVNGTRMSSDIVQETGNFRGIRNIELYPFTTDSAGVSKSTAIPSQIKLVGQSGYTTGATGASSTVDNGIAATSGANSALLTNSNSHLYKDVEIPIGTKSFIFYGEAIPTDGTQANAICGTLEKKVDNSKKTDDGYTTLEGISFNPVQICGNGALGENATAIATYVTNIANTTKTYTDPASTAKWSESTSVQLQSLYQSFTSMQAGSWASIQGAVRKLYLSLIELRDKTTVPTTKDMTEAIIANIENGTYVDLDNTKTNSTSLTAAKITFKELGNFPADIQLPDGAVYLNWDKTQNKFEMQANNDNTGLNLASVTSYVYPASLYYYVLSDIRTAEKPMLDKYTSEKSWSAITDDYGNTNKEVTAKTRSIAIYHPIQYAVGRMDITIQASGTALEDSKGNSITPGAETFPLTGVLIGGQKAVDYKFQQISSGTAYTIYDSKVTDGIYLTNGTPTKTTYTLVLETSDADETKDEDPDAIVKFALEFQNNSDKDIVGHDGKQVIYPGTKFYLIGTFDPNENTTQKYVGTADLIKRAFVQDYTTTANVKIASLKNAYNVMPDLTLPSLEMGLSVDLQWKTGISQDITIQ